MLTAHDYLDLLEQSSKVIYNPLARTIEFIDKASGFLGVDEIAHKVSEQFDRALSRMSRDERSSSLHFIETKIVRDYLEREIDAERKRKLRLLTSK